MPNIYERLTGLEVDENILTKNGYKDYIEEVQSIVSEEISQNPLLNTIYAIDGAVRYAAARVPVPPVVGTIVNWKDIAKRVLRGFDIEILEDWPESDDAFLNNSYAEMKTAVSILEQNAKRAADSTWKDYIDNLDNITHEFKEKWQTTKGNINDLLQHSTEDTLSHLGSEERDKVTKKTQDFNRNFEKDKAWIMGAQKDKELLDADDIYLVENRVYLPLYLHIRSLVGQIDRYLCFIALMEEPPSDSFTANYDSIEPFGSPQSIPIYNNSDRSIDIDFIIFPSDKDEHSLMVKQLNLLAGLTYPHLDKNNRPITNPNIELTLGQLYKNIPGVVTSVDVDWGNKWDTERQFPLYANISFSMDVVYDQVPGFESKFYSLPE